MMYLLPLLEVTGKRPVWSEKIWPVMAMTLEYTKWVRTFGSDVEGDVVMTVEGEVNGSRGGVFDVERRFFGVALR